MAPNAPEPPGTPTRKDGAANDNEFATRINFLCSNWDLGLDVNKRTKDAQGESTIDCKCVNVLRFCYHKDRLDIVLKEFDSKAFLIDLINS